MGMNMDQTFRIAPLGILMLIIPVGVYHRLRSQATWETLDRRQEGLFILVTLRPLGLLFMLGLVAYLVNPASMSWSFKPLPAWLRWAGVILGGLADGLLIWTFRRLGKNLTDTVVTRRDHTLVMDGPYRWVRHPFYVAVALLVSGLSLITANWFLCLTGAFVIGLLMIRTGVEEDKLLARFGVSYRAYMERTGRFFPRIRARRKIHGV